MGSQLDVRVGVCWQVALHELQVAHPTFFALAEFDGVEMMHTVLQSESAGCLNQKF